MANLTEIEIPAYVNRMPSFFLWELDEFMLIIGLIVIGYLMRGMWLWLFLIGGLYLAAQLKKWKQGELDGVIPHVLYRWGVMPLNAVYKNAHEETLWM